MITDQPRREAWSSVSSHGPQEEPSPPTRWFWTPSLCNCEAITLSHPVVASVAVPVSYSKCQVSIPSVTPSLFRSSLENLACVRAKLLQSCPTLRDPVDCSLPGSSVHRILQARMLQWVAISFSRAFSWPRAQTQVSCIAGRLFIDWATREAQDWMDLFT